jgi:8-oxo-dGTP pyrophosphatase MutT (NUDIX family)
VSQLDPKELFGADPTAASPLIPAATVLLLRDTDVGLEVLMLRKNRGQAFGGMWVFPGGKVDPGDAPDAGEPDQELAAARRAAQRETLEETGLVVAGDDFVPFSHWVPPPETPKRFSTWFFLAALPAGAADVVIDGGEIGDHVWTTPAGALERHRAREANLVPPTWVTLTDLAQFATTAEALAGARAVEPPHYATRFVDADGTVVTLWDPDAAYGTEPLDLDAPGARNRLHMRADGWVLERS